MLTLPAHPTVYSLDAKEFASAALLEDSQGQSANHHNFLPGQSPNMVSPYSGTHHNSLDPTS
jgi:hypothetical protein